MITSRATNHRSLWERVRMRALAIALPAAVLVAAAGCGAPTYPFDYFNEMHYQSYIRNQEPPRRQPPQGSVTYDPSVHPEAVASWRNPRGSQVEVDLGQAGSLRNPVPRTPENTERSRELYRVNCAVCHGREGKGDGIISAQFRAHNSPSIPVDFSQQRTRQRSEGEIWWLMSNGLANMPAFKHLLTEEERWLLTQFVQSVR